MDIAEHRIPQEGRVSLSVGDRQIDLRLATLPSMFGETWSCGCSTSRRASAA